MGTRNILNGFKWIHKSNFIKRYQYMTGFIQKGDLVLEPACGFDIIPPSVEREVKDFGENIVAVFSKNSNYYRGLRVQKTISAIVPAFNEEKTVTGVVEVLLNNPLINEVICVNDGSTDKTLTVLESFKDKIQLINFSKNKGKSYALVEGIKKAKGEIITFFDADLTNLSDNHIKTLVDPILESKFKVVLGYPSNGWLPNPFSDLTGERAYFKKDLVPYLDRMAKTKFGVEIFLNDLFAKNETKKVPLKQLRGLYKYEKHNSTNAIKEYLGEVVEIAQEIGKKEGLLPKDYQIIAQISKVTSLNQLKAKIKVISNKHLRQFLEKYVLKYIKIGQHWWNSF